MNENVKVIVWGREFDLSVKLQNFPDEDILDIQRETIEKIADIDYSNAKEKTEGYIEKYYSAELGEEGITNIFKYVMPKYVLVAREEDSRTFALMCNFKFDMEHGLAIVFKNEVCEEVGLQDIIL